MKRITILIPTYNRVTALAVLLTSLCFQDENDFNIVISDQYEEDILQENESLQTAIRLLETRKHKVTILRNLPRLGMAQQRQFLLDQSKSEYSLFLDDDLIIEPYVVGNMLKVISEEQCGFVGNAVIGLSYKYDNRPHQQLIEFWEERVEPEAIAPQSKEWQRYVLHNAANIYHVQERLEISPDNPQKYKVAWIGGCTMYDTQKLEDVGGFRFWQELPINHCGEDVLAQLKVMKKYGGCGIIPSGVYHQELKTTVEDRRVNAPEYIAI